MMGFALAVAGALFVLRPLDASAGDFTIGCGQTKTGALAAAAADRFTFEAGGGETVSVTTARNDTSTFVPCWTLLAPSATPGGPAEQLGGMECRQAERLLPRAGAYTIRVSGTPGAGAYTVSLEVVSGAFGGASNGPPEPVCSTIDVLGNEGDGTQPIRCGEQKEADVEVPGETDTFTFVAVGTQSVIIRTQASNANGRAPCWQLFSPPATPGAPAERLGATQCTMITQTLQRAGVYTIKVFHPSPNELEVGGYRVTLTQVGGCPCGNRQRDLNEICDPTLDGCCTAFCTIKPVGEECRPSARACDAAEVCNGIERGCPADVFEPSGTECRRGIGPCDVTEFCTGASDACPPDGFAPSGVVCRALAGDCDLAESCTGTAPVCPADAKSRAVCRDPNGPCDVTERCDGVANACPSDRVATTSTVCRAAVGVCDKAENCPGDSSACPVDAKAAPGSSCADDGNACTRDECDGVAIECQHPAAAAGVVCRASIGFCDVAETCDGTSTTCPVDAHRAEGLTCDDARFCTEPDACRNGVCTGPERPCGDGKSCTVDGCDERRDVCLNRPANELCNDSDPCTSDRCGPGTDATGCVHDLIVGQTCEDGVACTAGETCQANGSCSGGGPRTCPSGPCSAGECREDAGGCVATPINEGQSCDDGNACTEQDACRAGACAGTALACDDGDPCSGDRCDAGGCVHEPVPDGTSCDNGNQSGGDRCRAGACMDTTCSGAAEGGACDDGNACSDGDVCQGGVCAGATEPCAVQLPCAAGGDGSCRVGVLCTGNCVAYVNVRVLALPGSRCSVELVDRVSLASPGLVGQRAGGRKRRRLSVVATGKIDGGGQLLFGLKLNRRARSQLSSSGTLAADAVVRIKEPGGRRRTVERLVTFVRAG